MEQKPVNPMYRPMNSGYGDSWQASQGLNPSKIQAVPAYKDVGERDLALRNTMKTYKHEVLKEMRERGELDTQVYGKIKKDMAAIKKEDVVPRDFPSKAEDLRYPENALNTGSMLYRTTAQLIGNQKPSNMDQPTKYFPRPESFTKTFLGGNFHDTGLNTFKTPSRVHGNYDQ